MTISQHFSGTSHLSQALSETSWPPTATLGSSFIPPVPRQAGVLTQE